MHAGSGIAGRLRIGVLTLGMLSLWVLPGQAVKVVRKGSRAVVADKDRRAEDTARISTRALLNDVELQRNHGSATDSLDTWIDRDGDGVNDRLQKSPASDKPDYRSRPAARPAQDKQKDHVAPVRKESIKPKTQDKDRIKSPLPSSKKSVKKEDRKTPPSKESTKSTDDAAKKKRRR